jgi:hypothetical protein
MNCLKTVSSVWAQWKPQCGQGRTRRLHGVRGHLRGGSLSSENSIKGATVYHQHDNDGSDENIMEGMPHLFSRWSRTSNSFYLSLNQLSIGGTMFL